MKQLLSPKELASAIGVSQSSIKRWADEGLISAARTAGGHRRIHVSEAIRFLRESDAVLIRPHLLGLPSNTRVGRGSLDLEASASELIGHLEAGSARDCAGLVFSLYLSGCHLAQIVDGPVRAAMADMGHRWGPQGDEGILQEHQATQIMFRTFHELRSYIPEVADGPLAIGGAPSGDPYQLASLLVGLVLASEGYRVVNLGAQTPISTLRQAFRSRRPRLIWLSVSSAPEPEAVGEKIRGLLGELSGSGTVMVLGGKEAGRLGLDPHPQLWVGQSMGELLAFSKGLGLAGPAHRSDEN